MADKRAERIAELIKPLQVKSESKVHLAKDFDPGYKADLVKKWFARICVSAVLVDTLMQIDPRFPAVSAARRQELLIVKGEREAEAPRGAAADPFTAQQEREQARESAAQAGQVQQDKKPEQTADQGA